MQQALAYIERWTTRMESHPFFAALKPEPDLKRAMAFAQPAAFWVFTFQDILRLNAELACDPAIQALLRQHQSEDAGHEEWFLEDLERIFGSAPTHVRWLFSSENYGIRASSFALAGEVFRVSDDRLRLVLVEALERAAGFFFGRAARYLAESGHTTKLKYFGGMHITAEAGHEIHDQEARDLLSIVLPPELQGDAEALVDRMFKAFTQLADQMLVHQQAAASAG
jgi:hypothetical protein